MANVLQVIDRLIDPDYRKPSTPDATLKRVADSLQITKKLDPKIVKGLRDSETKILELWDRVETYTAGSAKSAVLAQAAAIAEDRMEPGEARSLPSMRENYQVIRQQSKAAIRDLGTKCREQAVEAARVYADACIDEAQKIELVDKASHERFGFEYSPSAAVRGLRQAAETAKFLAGKDAPAKPSGRLPWLF